MAWLWALVVGGLIGWAGWYFFARENENGVWWSIILGFLGAWAGSAWLGNWGGLVWSGFWVWPGVVGALIAVVITVLVLRNNDPAYK